jgi:hypothetical protein
MGPRSATEVALGKGVSAQRQAVEADHVRLLSQIEHGVAGHRGVQQDPGTTPSLPLRHVELQVCVDTFDIDGDGVDAVAQGDGGRFVCQWHNHRVYSLAVIKSMSAGV